MSNRFTEDDMTRIANLAGRHDEVDTILCHLCDIAYHKIDGDEALIACEEIASAAHFLGISFEQREASNRRRPVFTVGGEHDRFREVV